MIIKKESSEDVDGSTQADESKVQERDVKTSDKETKTHLTKIDCKYFITHKGCRRGKSCWFSHENKAFKQKIKGKNSKKKNVKIEPTHKESNHEDGSTLKQILIELLKLCISGKINM